MQVRKYKGKVIRPRWRAVQCHQCKDYFKREPMVRISKREYLNRVVLCRRCWKHYSSSYYSSINTMAMDWAYGLGEERREAKGIQPKRSW